MTQGYIFLGVDDTNSVVNITSAYALSISLKLADPTRETCVVVSSFHDVPKKYEDGFDYIVELPFKRTEINHRDVLIDFWQLYYCTPFDQTLFIDTQSIAVDNVDSLWEVADFGCLEFASARNFRGELDYHNSQFDVQRANTIVPFDSGMIYFSKDLESSQFFKVADPYFKNWRIIYRDMLNDTKPMDFDFTLMVNLIAGQLGIQPIKHDHFDYTDLTISVLGSDSETTRTDWIRTLNVWYTKDAKLKINNHRQSGIVRYNSPEFITKEMLTKLNDHYRNTTTKIQA